PRDESLGKNAQLALAGGCPPQISHSRDRPGGPERKKNSSAPAPGSQLSPPIIEVMHFFFFSIHNSR
ncbi:MAG: hypothetical protein J7M32_03060, partial [Deltaproteobacteria bacterium]|nr:hypothetical protein [Deltaproteobacteria bacterium]